MVEEVEGSTKRRSACDNCSLKKIRVRELGSMARDDRDREIERVDRKKKKSLEENMSPSLL